MQTIDWIALGVVLVAVLIGALLGFGKCLKLFTSGIVGIVISVVVTYFLIGVVSSWGFVQNLLTAFDRVLVESENGFCSFLNTIGIETIVLAVVLFIIVQLVRIFVVNIIKGVSESENTVVRVINKSVGALFSLAFFLMVVLLVFQIVYLIGGETAENFSASLTGAFKINWLFENNPLRDIADFWQS